MKAVVIIPTYNERENISHLIERIFSLSVPNLGILVVDDNSPDGTSSVVEKLRSKYPGLGLLTRPAKLGLGSAYVAGFRQALVQGAKLIFEMDADGSHDPREVPRLISIIKGVTPSKVKGSPTNVGYTRHTPEISRQARNDIDVVIGSRRVPGGKIVGWNRWRHFTSWAATLVARLMLRLKTKDVTAGFRCYSRDVLEQIDLSTVKSNGYAFQVEMLWRCELLNFLVVEIPITFVDRERGRSKLSWRDVAEFFVTLIRLRFRKRKEQRAKLQSKI